MRRSSTAFYLFVLSCLDLVSLLAGVPVLFLADVFELVVRNKSNLMCKLQPFATYILTQVPSYTLDTDTHLHIDLAIASQIR